MTLRDYFAAHALQGMLAAREPVWQNQFKADWANAAYKWADAMLAERARKETP